METKHHRSTWGRVGALAAIAATSALTSFAETRSVSLDDCVKMALQKNLDIRIAYYSPKQALSQFRQSYGAWDPNINFGASQSFRQQPGLQLPGQPFIPGAEYWNENYSVGVSGNSTPFGTGYGVSFAVPRASQEGAGGFTYTPSLTLNLSQSLLRNFWIDQPRLAIEVGRLGIKRSEQDVQELVISVSTQVALAYHDVIAARESVRVQKKAVETSERRLAEQKKRVEVGALAPLDEKQSEAEVFRTRADLLRAEGSLGDALARLRNLVSDDFAALDDTAFDPSMTLTAVPVAFDKKDSWHKALTQRPDVVRAGIGLEQQKIRRKFTYNQLFPQLDLRGTYGLGGLANHLGDSLDDIGARNQPNHSVGIVLSFPLSNRSAREANKQAKLEQERLLLDYKRIEQNAMRDIDISIRAAKTQFERVGATKKAREFAAQALEAEEKKLANGKSTAFQVLELQRQLTAAESDEISALSEYNKELYRLSQAEGDTLKKLGILLDFK